MAPKLYIILPSPPVRSVLICAKALGLELDLVPVDLMSGEHLQPWFLKLNPRHTVPVLQDEDGFVVTDSHAIMSYLVSKYGKDKSLYPVDLKKRTLVDEKLHFDSNVLFARGLGISRSILFGNVSKVSEEQKEPVREAMSITEQFLEKTKWIAGNELTIADFSFATSVAAWAVFVDPIEESRYPRIYKWMKELEKLPYFIEGHQEGQNIYEDMVHRRLAENAKKA